MKALIKDLINFVSILILLDYLFLWWISYPSSDIKMEVSILILLDYLFLCQEIEEKKKAIAVSILILLDYLFLYLSYIFVDEVKEIVSILILLDYLFLYLEYSLLSSHFPPGLNPYFIGLSILISSTTNG